MENNTEKSDSIFERLQGLYQLDPDEFNRISEAIIREELNRVPEDFKARAFGIQRRIEQKLKKYKDPIARMNAMVEIFWQQFHEFQEVLNDPREVLKNKYRSGRTAKVIPFKERGTRH